MNPQYRKVQTYANAFPIDNTISLEAYGTSLMNGGLAKKYISVVV